MTWSSPSSSHLPPLSPPVFWTVSGMPSESPSTRAHKTPKKALRQSFRQSQSRAACPCGGSFTSGSAAASKAIQAGTPFRRRPSPYGQIIAKPHCIGFRDRSGCSLPHLHLHRSVAAAATAAACRRSAGSFGLAPVVGGPPTELMRISEACPRNDDLQASPIIRYRARIGRSDPWMAWFSDFFS